MDKKEYAVDVSWKEDILWVILTGKVTRQSASDISRIVFETAQESKPTKMLIDCTQLVGRMSIVDTYYHVQEYPPHSQSYRADRAAIVDTPENVAYYSFHETAAANVGTYMKYFTDINEAIGWLNQ